MVTIISEYKKLPAAPLLNALGKRHGGQILSAAGSQRVSNDEKKTV
jgi:hypothetical protein